MRALIKQVRPLLEDHGHRPEPIPARLIDPSDLASYVMHATSQAGEHDTTHQFIDRPPMRSVRVTLPGMSEQDFAVAAWKRIEGWLVERAPASAALLRPPASDADVDAVQEAIGVVFPPALRAWYKLHDGIDDPGIGKSWWPAGFLPGAQGWYPLETLRDAYTVQIRDQEREPGRIPFSCVVGDMWHGLYVDARLGEPSYGSLGRWFVDREPELLTDPVAGWPLHAWLSRIADALEQGRCLVGPDGNPDEDTWPALTECGGLVWVAPDEEPHSPPGRVLLGGGPLS
ncbi:SMI1/KNR4 family protein [Streptomyces sp. NPDC056230]|uniref:SMI1/KNR4 family protein n=1 Tax=Streptomyces sp. NPDC056230 TaxID=3345754 RepID=UPI0035E0FD31